MAVVVRTDRGDGIVTPEQFDKWRIMPRILMTVYYTFYIFAFWRMASWAMDYDYQSLSSDTMALAIVGFPTAILGVLGGVLASLTKNYFNTPGTNGG